MFRLDMLPAAQGDCLWIEYGDAGDPKRILIDGGPATDAAYGALSARLRDLPLEQRHFELIVVSHIDTDHIDGAVKLLEDDLDVTYDDFWFNGFQHLLPEVETFGGRSGERLTSVLRNGPWNEHFGGRAIVTVPGEVVEKTLPGGMKLILLSPGVEQLRRLYPAWKQQAEQAGLKPGSPPPLRDTVPGFETFGAPNVEQLARRTYEPDSAVANGSSIALCAEYEGARAVLLADAFAEVVRAALDDLVGDDAELETDVVKVSHHGSRGNTSSELVKRLESTRWLFSASGAYYQHPDLEAVARVVKDGPHDCELVFNYRSKYNQPWDNANLKQRYAYRTQYPSLDETITEVTLR